MSFAAASLIMLSLNYMVLSIVIVLIIIRKCREYIWGIHNDKSSLKGKVFLITGANSGIGKETARQLAERQATVIMACRNKQATQSAIEDIRKSTKNGELNYHNLDLSSLDSVRQFSDEILQQYSKIDVLINNAGVGVPFEKDMKTLDGFEIHFGVNHLGHFLLTQLLMPKLIESAPSRIVIISSSLHERGHIDFDDLSLDKLRRSGAKFTIDSPGYCNSKLANVYHGRELAERLKNSNVHVGVVCPGLIYTNIFQHHDTKWWHIIVAPFVALWLLRSTWQGSQTTMYLATEKNLPGVSGSIYKNVKLAKPKISYDINVQKKLWELSESLVQIRRQ